VPEARARDATRLELLVFFFLSISPFFLLHVYFRCIQHIETAMAAATAAWVQDVTTGLETWTTGAAGEEDNG
jgi:hypothetical protein